MAPQNAPFATEIRPYGKAAIEEAARLILEGLPVAIPTETVYGLAADATNDDAVRRIYTAKGRPQFNPLIVHVLDLAQAEELADFTESSRAIARRYWPGALTLVVRRKTDAALAASAVAGLPTVALRCPAHPAMRDLLAASGKPLAAPSANASGTISPTTAEHVLSSLGARIPLIVDSGPTEHGIESTIVRVGPEGICLLRPGPLAIAEIARHAGLVEGAASAAIQAPGQLQSHYAPSKPLRLNVHEPAPDEWMIGYGAMMGDDTLSAAGDLAEAASRLFGALHRADAQPKARIAVAPVPEEGLGIAINDRLRRAAAPHA